MDAQQQVEQDPCKAPCADMRSQKTFLTRAATGLLLSKKLVPQTCSQSSWGEEGCALLSGRESPIRALRGGSGRASAGFCPWWGAKECVHPLPAPALLRARAATCRSRGDVAQRKTRDPLSLQLPGSPLSKRPGWHF